MRLSIVLLLLALAGILGGGWLIGRPAFGAAVIFDSLAVGALALMRDNGKGSARQQIRPRVPGEGATVHEVLERARISS